MIYSIVKRIIILIALDDPVIDEISKKYNVSNAQVCIGYALAKGLAVVTKTENETRMKNNLQSIELSKQLTKEDMDLISTLNRNQRNHVDLYSLK